MHVMKYCLTTTWLQNPHLMRGVQRAKTAQAQRRGRDQEDLAGSIQYNTIQSNSCTINATNRKIIVVSYGNDQDSLGWNDEMLLMLCAKGVLSNGDKKQKVMALDNKPQKTGLFDIITVQHHLLISNQNNVPAQSSTGVWASGCLVFARTCGRATV